MVALMSKSGLTRELRLGSKSKTFLRIMIVCITGHETPAKMLQQE